MALSVEKRRLLSTLGTRRRGWASRGEEALVKVEKKISKGAPTDAAKRPVPFRWLRVSVSILSRGKGAAVTHRLDAHDIAVPFSRPWCASISNRVNLAYINLPDNRKTAPFPRSSVARTTKSLRADLLSLETCAVLTSLESNVHPPLTKISIARSRSQIRSRGDRYPAVSRGNRARAEGSRFARSRRFGRGYR